MDNSETALRVLCERLEVDASFFQECLRGSVIEIEEINGELQLGNGTLLRMRRLQRICLVFDVDLPVALLLLSLSQPAARLQAQGGLAHWD